MEALGRRKVRFSLFLHSSIGCCGRSCLGVRCCRVVQVVPVRVLAPSSLPLVVVFRLGLGLRKGLGVGAVSPESVVAACLDQHLRVVVVRVSEGGAYLGPYLNSTGPLPHASWLVLHCMSSMSSIVQMTILLRVERPTSMS